jgi:hypothetical protein
MTVEDSVYLVVGVIFLFVVIGYGVAFIALYPHVWDNYCKKYYRKFFKK